MFSHEHAYTCTFAVIIDERPVTPYLSDVDSPTAGSKQFDWVAKRAALL